ncbi:hypothetical protein SFC66_04520 [Terribacillus saccharophilus]|uniref:hypothetical protein n=1 Tax=Terribacillus saccharophilus TaxID=361277 RepID=UPI0039824193
MGRFNRFTDNDLIYKESQISNWRERQRIGDELKWRGYEKDVAGKWSKPEDSYETSEGSILEFVLVFLPIAMIITLLGLIVVLPPALYDFATQQIPIFVSDEVKPVLNAYEGNIILLQASLPIIGVLFFIGFTAGFLLVLFLLTFTKIRISYFFKAHYLFFLLGSVFMAYNEWKIDGVHNLQLIIFIFTFLLSLFSTFKAKKNWKIGLYTFLFSTIAFIISGTSLITPYIALSIAAASIIIFPGKFFERPKKREYNTI